jgi:hypothetical protein
VTRLLVRDLAQLATPSDAEPPLRGSNLGDVRVLHDAYVLCRDGEVEQFGRMSELEPIAGDVEELDGR